MSRLTISARDDVPEASKPILDAVNRQLGVVPDMVPLFATSPAALTGLTSLDGANAKTLDLKTRTGIALAVTRVNGRDYCVSAHSSIGMNGARITPEEAMLNRKGSSGHARIAAALRFAARVARARGQATDDDLAAVRDAGYREAQVVEIVSVVAQNVLTNFVNDVARTDIDVPVVDADDLKAA